MGAAFVPIIAVVVLIVIGVVLVRRLQSHTVEQHDQVSDEKDQLLYRVPSGQDPAAVLVALSRGGFEAAAEPGDTRHLRIACPLGPQQREEVRTVLENETTMSISDLDSGDPHAERPTGPVRFDDE